MMISFFKKALNLNKHVVPINLCIDVNTAVELLKKGKFYFKKNKIYSSKTVIYIYINNLKVGTIEDIEGIEIKGIIINNRIDSMIFATIYH
ncbi:hypothetical protein [Pseudoalteromonas sp.]|uniref:hypothetical protein n=1 Tax=Pseudoalteromonas sp. TaxID=53249 RepID=UPI0026158BC1|nr:hypothetical protein [Pseudoalteromonas sp.]MCP4586906.1 hypothetical protein [Pseudoalteromonas sp.]